MRATLDANIIVSAANGFMPPISPLGNILRAGYDGRYTIVTSTHIIDEVRFALSKPFFSSHLAPGIVDQILSDLERKGERVELVRAVEGIATHWQDDLILSTCLSGNADVLVTGDRELLDLKHPFPFRIIPPGEFRTLLESGSGDE